MARDLHVPSCWLVALFSNPDLGLESWSRLGGEGESLLRSFAVADRRHGWLQRLYCEFLLVLDCQLLRMLLRNAPEKGPSQSSAWRRPSTLLLRDNDSNCSFHNNTKPCPRPDVLSVESVSSSIRRKYVASPSYKQYLGNLGVSRSSLIQSLSNAAFCTLVFVTLSSLAAAYHPTHQNSYHLSICSLG